MTMRRMARVTVTAVLVRSGWVSLQRREGRREEAGRARRGRRRERVQAERQTQTSLLPPTILW